MVNRAAGEIYKTSSILAQTFGETVATAFGLVSLPEIRRQTLSGAGKRGGNRRRQTLRLSGRRYRQRPARQRPCPGARREDRLVVGRGRARLRLPNLAGGLTQTVPTGTQKVRPVGFATNPTRLDFRPLWGTGATYEVNFPDIPASHGDILVRSATAWGAVPGTTIGAHPLVPDLRNRILRIKDAADNDSGDPPGLGPEVRVRRIHAGESQRDRVRRVLDSISIRRACTTRRTSAAAPAPSTIPAPTAPQACQALSCGRTSTGPMP